VAPYAELVSTEVNIGPAWTASHTVESQEATPGQMAFDGGSVMGSGGSQWGRSRSTEPVEDVGQAQAQRAYTWKYRE
jgi:hypothetical protein